MTHFPRKALVADIGGSNARFAIADLETLELQEAASFPSAQYSSLQDVIAAYLATLTERPEAAALAVAAPMDGDRYHMTNLPWNFTREELQAAAGVRRLTLVNDFVALAYSLPDLAASELHRIHALENARKGTRIVLGPGTGLGLAALVRCQTGWTAIPGEGGHISLPVRDARELAIRLKQAPDGGHVSAEDFLSGPGLVRLHDILAELEGVESPELDAAEITSLALRGEDWLAGLAMRHFVEWLARHAGDMALAFGATGGVYLGGGIAPRILPLLEDGRFSAAFADKGRFSAYLERIPVHVILAPDASLRGAAIVAAQTAGAAGSGMGT